MIFQGSHYQLIRENPSYRMMCALEELQAEREPSWCQEIKHQETEHPVVAPLKPERNERQKDYIEQLQGRILYLQNKLDAHMDKSPAKRKSFDPFEPNTKNP